MQIIDTHVHVFSEDRKKYPQVKDTAKAGTIPEMNGQGQWEPTSAEALLKLMDESGVAKATLVQAYYIYEYDNRYTADSARKYPDRFSSSVILDPLDPKSPDELSRLVETEGVTAMRFMRARLPTSSLGDPRTFPLWARLQQLKIPLAINDKIADITKIRAATERYPDVKVAFEHCFSIRVGPPPYTAISDLFAFADNPNVYVKTAINCIHGAREGGGTVREFYQKLVDVFGVKRIMWSSNYPAHPSLGGYKHRLDTSLKELSFLSPSDQEWIFGKTALSVYTSLQ